jgi:hypothetical protein
MSQKLSVRREAVFLELAKLIAKARTLERDDIGNGAYWLKVVRELEGVSTANGPNLPEWRTK